MNRPHHRNHVIFASVALAVLGATRFGIAQPFYPPFGEDLLGAEPFEGASAPACALVTRRLSTLSKSSPP